MYYHEVCQSGEKCEDYFMDENIARQFQVLINDPAQYKKLAYDQWSEIGIYVPYWRVLPTYQISRCPFTGMPHMEMLDTYSLHSWGIRYSSGTSVDYARQDPVYSDQFVAVQAFLNLNGYKPRKNELTFGRNDASILENELPEVPFITPYLLPDDIESYAVMHALPIGKIVGDGFIPRYTLYVITYYAAEPETLLKRRWEQWTQGRKMNIPMNFYAVPRTDYWELTEQNPEMWDLTTWIKRGKLQWLDVADPDLPLHTDVEGFPYSNIQGMRHGYRYEPGQPIQIVKTVHTLEQFNSTPHYFAD
jgi:hypothetical protein